jgi:hypothetical protein
MTGTKFVVRESGQAIVVEVDFGSKGDFSERLV